MSDDAEPQERPSSRAASGRASSRVMVPWRKLTAHALMVRKIVASQPLIAIIPMLLWAAAIAGGIVAVHTAGRQAEGNARVQALSLAEQTASSMALQLVNLYHPVLAIAASIVNTDSNYLDISGSFPALAAQLLDDVDAPDSILAVAPQGVVTPLFHPSTSAWAHSLVGLDLLRLPTVLQMVQEATVSLQGPYQDRNIPFRVMVVRQAVFVNATLSETWDQPVNTSVVCPPSICFIRNGPTTGLKFWGLIIGAFSFDSLVSGDKSQLKTLLDKGYNYRLTSPATASAKAVVLTQSERPPSSPESAQVLPYNQLGSGAFVPWTLEVSPIGGWYLSWVPWTHFAVVIMSTVLAALLFALLITMRQHQLLLYSLVPENVVNELKAAEVYFGDHTKKHASYAASSPAELLLTLLSEVLQGILPVTHVAVACRAALLSCKDVYQPLDLNMRFKESDLDDDVARALMRELNGLPEQIMKSPRLRRSQSSVGTFTEEEEKEEENSEWSMQAVIMGLMRKTPAVLRQSISTSTASRHLRASGAEPRTASSSMGGAPPTSASAYPSTSAPSTYTTVLNPNPNHIITALSAHVLPHTSPFNHQSLGPGAVALPANGSVFQINQLMSNQSATMTQSQPFNVQDGMLSSASQGGGRLSAQEGSLLGTLQWMSKKSRHSSHCEQTSNNKTNSYDPSLISSEQARAMQNWGGILSVPEPPIYDEVLAMLDHASRSWSFDALTLAEATGGHALSTLGFYLLQSNGLLQQFDIRPAKAARFMRAIEVGYTQYNTGLCPYHNSAHAADVMQTMHALMTLGGLTDGYIDPLEQLACLLAAAAHDLQHQGLTNDYLVTMEDDLALLYSDKSPMENHHLACLYNLLKQPELNILSHLPQASRRRMRKIMIELVLGTDMKQHFSIAERFSALHHVTKDDLTTRLTPSTSTVSPAAATAITLGSFASGGLGQGGSCSAPIGSVRLPSPAGLDQPSSPSFMLSSHQSFKSLVRPKDDAEHLLSLQVMLKCADIGSLAEPFGTYMKWVTRLEDEFFQQGDKEKAAGLPEVSPLFDRAKPGITKCQMGFFSFVALPLAHAMVTAFPGMDPFWDGMLSNYRHWQSEAKAEQAGELLTNHKPSVVPHPEGAKLPSLDTGDENIKTG